MTDIAESRKTIAAKGVDRVYDALKHLTTLDTGSIVLLATFIERIFKNPEWKILVGVTFVLFGTSLFSSVTGLFFISFNELRTDPNRLLVADYLVKRIIETAVAAYWAFFLGVIAFVVFSLKNFY